MGPCKLAHWLQYSGRLGPIEGFRTGGREAGLRILLVLVLAKGSQVIYYQGSHLHDLPVLEKMLSRGLPQTTRAVLDDAGCIAVPIDYLDGAL